MVSHMVFLTKLGFENLKNLVTPSPFCKVGRVTELLDGKITSSHWKTKHFQGLDDDFGLKRPNHHQGPEYVHLLGQKKYVYGETFLRIFIFAFPRITVQDKLKKNLLPGIRGDCYGRILI